MIAFNATAEKCQIVPLASTIPVSRGADKSSIASSDHNAGSTSAQRHTRWADDEPQFIQQYFARPQRSLHGSYYRPLEYERVYLPLCKVADTPFHIQGGRLE